MRKQIHQRSEPRRGYLAVMAPDHPRARRNGTIYVHVLLAEKALGRPLPRTAQVHHANGDERDNSRGNLVICENQVYHCLLHQRTRSLRATGSPHSLRCSICLMWGHASLFIVRRKTDSQGYSYNSARHRSCWAKEAKRYRERIKNRELLGAPQAAS